MPPRMRTLHLPIADPCHEDWDAMSPEAQGRFCGKCTKRVHDLSSMTEDEAQALLRARAGGRICVRYEHEADGRIRFRRALPVLAAAGVALAACTPHDRPFGRTMGDVAPVVESKQPVRATMGEPPPVAPAVVVQGEIAAVQPEPARVVKGDIAVPNEPCDPPPPAK